MGLVRELSNSAIKSIIDLNEFKGQVLIQDNNITSNFAPYNT